MSVPAQHKALVVETPQAPFVVKTVDVQHPGPGEVLVKIEATALNPADWKFHTGAFIQKYPTVFGFDAAGTIAELGEGVTSFTVGDRVFVEGWTVFAEKVAYGTFRQYFTAPTRTVGKIPDSLSFEDAATIPVGLATAAFPLYNTEGTRTVGLTPPWVEGGQGKYANKPIFVLAGASSVGQFVIQLARLSGFSPIITTASLHNTDYLKSLGATHVIDRKLSAEQTKAEATKLIGGGLFDVVYDAVTLEDTRSLGYALTAPGGDFIVVGDGPIAGRDEAADKRVHVAFGMFNGPANHTIGTSLLAALPKLLEGGLIKPARPEILPGGLGAIPGGLDRLKNNQVSGTKLVVRPFEE